MWAVNGLIIRILRQWWEDIYRWRGLGLRKVTLSGNVLLLQETTQFSTTNTFVCCNQSNQLYGWNTGRNQCPSMHTLPKPLAHPLMEQTLRLEGRFVLPLANGEKKKKNPTNNLSSLSSVSFSKSSSQPQLLFGLVMLSHGILQVEQIIKKKRKKAFDGKK